MNELLRQQYEQSAYRELYHLNGEGHALVIDEVTGALYVRKRRSTYNEAVYRYLMTQDCPYLPRIHAVWKEEGCLVVMEEYIQGETLAGRLKGGPLTEQESVRIIEQVCDGLSCLHSADPPVIHRDIKPSNLMLDQNGSVKIIDYDAAKVYRSGADRDTVLIGTAGSAAPEQYGFRQSDARTDIYAVGVLLRQLFPDRPEMQRIADRATQMDPDRRFASAEALKQRVCAAAGGSRPQRASVIPVPGFRSGTPWKMAVAIAGFALLFFLGLTLRVEHADGPLDLWVNRIAFLAVGLGLIDLFTGWTGLYRSVTLLRHENPAVRVVGYVLLAAFAVIVPVLAVVIFENLAIR